MVVDSSVFVDLTRDYKPAQEVFRNLLFKQSASLITELELIVGTSTKVQMSKTLKLLKTLEITILPINEDISKIASNIFRVYYHSHGISIEDTLIAATALFQKEELVTKNLKHFQFIPNLKIVAPY